MCDRGLGNVRCACTKEYHRVEARTTSAARAAQRLPHHRRHLADRERFLQEPPEPEVADVPRELLIVVARHQHHAKLGVADRQDAQQLTPAHLRHREVEQHELRHESACEERQRFLTARRQHRAVAKQLERALDDTAHGRLVIHDEHGEFIARRCGDAARPRQTRRPEQPGRVAGIGGQVQPERGTGAWRRGNRDRPAVRSDDAECRGQTEPVARELGGEEGIEDALERLPVHAGAGIADLEDDERSSGWHLAEDHAGGQQ